MALMAGDFGMTDETGQLEYRVVELEDKISELMDKVKELTEKLRGVETSSQAMRDAMDIIHSESREALR